MIKNVPLWERWEQEWEASQPVDVQQNIRIVNALYDEARALGIFPLKNPMEGIEDKIRLARDLNV